MVLIMVLVLAPCLVLPCPALPCVGHILVLVTVLVLVLVVVMILVIVRVLVLGLFLPCHVVSVPCMRVCCRLTGLDAPRWWRDVRRARGEPCLQSSVRSVSQSACHVLSNGVGKPYIGGSVCLLGASRASGL